MSTSIDQKEIEHFSKDSAHWWDEAGPFAPLHKLNPQRLTYIREQIIQHYDLDDNAQQPFKGLKILDSDSHPPEDVAKIIAIALTARKPKKVYNVNVDLLFRLLAGLPAGLSERLMTYFLKKQMA